jgi:hypothetical protein
MSVRILPALVCLVFLLPQSSKAEEPADGFLEVSFYLNPTSTEEFAASYQTVVWLETPDCEYVRSLLVSEYMAYGGFMEPELCPRWHEISNWEVNYETEMDAVTAATPGLERTVLTFDCAKEKIMPGKYKYCVQTHIVEDYNILYCGEIRIGGEENENVAEVTYTPSENPDANQVLVEVEARYHQQLNQ